LTVPHPYSIGEGRGSINKLRVKLATGRDANLVRLPPSEAALRQQILRASFQTKVWHAACLARHSERLELPFSCGNWSCSTQDLSEIRSLQNNETARQKRVHDYVVNTLNSSARVYEWMLFHALHGL
jgi:hypothetical protein